MFFEVAQCGTRWRVAEGVVDLDRFWCFGVGVPESDQKRSRWCSVNLGCGVFFYLLTLLSWYGGNFPFRGGWLGRLSGNVRELIAAPSEILLVLAAVFGGGLFTLAGLLCFGLVRWGKCGHQRFEAALGLWIGWALLIMTGLGCLGS